MDLDIANELRYPNPYVGSPLLPLLLLSLSTQKHSPNVKSTFKKEYDYTVVGSGFAGSVVASRLSEVPCVSVLLLEAGGVPPRITELPAMGRNFFTTDIDWQYLTTPQKYTAAGHRNRQIPYPSGKGLGGSSITGCLIYERGNRRNYDEWAKLGAKGWSYKEVLPYFKKLEDNTDREYVKNGFHATGGPVTVSSPVYYPKKKLMTMQAVHDEGLQFVDPNAYEQIGFYDHQAYVRRGQRCSTAKSYLVPSESRTNLDILPNAMVTKIMIKKKRAVGVQFNFNGVNQHVLARKEVILSAGVANSAQLLMLSGIGPMTELKKFKIPVLADLPVGFNLQDHPASLLVYTVDKRVSRFKDEVLDERNIKDYIHKRIGPLSSTEGVQLTSYLNNQDFGDKIPDYSVYFGDFLDLTLLQYGFSNEVMTKYFQPLSNQSVLICFSQLLRTRSTGTVTLQSKNPYDAPLIDPNFLADFQDLNDVVEGLKRCQRLVKNPAMKKIDAKLVEIPVPGCEEFVKDEELYLRCVARTFVITIGHQMGTAKMGHPKDPTTVVDPQLRVKGIKGLRVVDSSVMPSIPWSGTNIPTVMIAEKASDMIKNTIRCHGKY